MNNNFGCASNSAVFSSPFFSIGLRARINQGAVFNSCSRSYLFRFFFLLAFVISLCQQVAAQEIPRDLSTRPAWNGRDAVIHRPGDKPYSLYHLSGRYPHILKRPKEICNYYAFYTGMWIPTGRDRVLGSHPLLGINFGQWINRFMWDFNLEFQLGGTSTAYNVIYNGVPTTSNHYGGNYIGLNFGYSLVSVKKSVVYLTGGIGGTGFVAVKGDNDHDALSINSFTTNCGLGLHHFSKKGNLFGAMLLYNFVDYQNPGGTPMDGNAVTLRLIYGGFE
jgi:hypothetical protein